MKADPADAVARVSHLLIRLTLQHYQVCVNPLLLLLCEEGVPAEQIFLSVEAADDDSHEEVQKEEGADDHEGDEEEHPVALRPLLPGPVDLCHLRTGVHEVLPGGDIAHDEQGYDGLDDVIEVVEFVDPQRSRVQAVPLVGNHEIYGETWDRLPDDDLIAVEEGPLEEAHCDDAEHEKEENHDRDNFEYIGDGLDQGLKTHLQALVARNQPQRADDSEHLENLEVLTLRHQRD